MYPTDLRIGEVVSKFVSGNIPSYWPFFIERFEFIFLLRDSEYDLFNVSFSMVEKQSIWKLWWINSHNSATPIHITEYFTSFPLVHLRSSHMRLSSTYFLIC